LRVILCFVHVMGYLNGGWGWQLWNSDHGHVMEACKDSLKNLQIDYLDLYLIHFPVATRHTGSVFRKVLLNLTRMPSFSPFWEREKMHWHNQNCSTVLFPLSLLHLLNAKQTPLVFSIVYCFTFHFTMQACSSQIVTTMVVSKT
jgi:hypothetical protein